MKQRLPFLLALTLLAACDRSEKPSSPAAKPDAGAQTDAAKAEDAAKAVNALKNLFGAGDRAKRTQAQVVLVTLVNAVSQFELDCDRFPVPVSATKGTDCETDSTSEEGFISILKGLDKEQNSRGLDYIGELPMAKKDGSKLVGGLNRETEDTLALVDPWGLPYRITLDLDGDDKVTNPDPQAKNPELHKKVIVWSAGPDRQRDTWEDNVCSWDRE